MQARSEIEAMTWARMRRPFHQSQPSIEGDDEDVAVEDVKETKEGSGRIGGIEVAEEAVEILGRRGRRGENHESLVGGVIAAHGDADGEKNEEAADVDDVDGDEGVRKGAVGFDLHHDGCVDTDGAHDAHEAGPCDEDPAELAVDVNTMPQDEKELRGEEEHPDGEGCCVQVQE